MSPIDHLIEEGRELLESKVPNIVNWVTHYETDDYPSGRHRVKATWDVEHKGRESRVARVTFHPVTGKAAKPKKTTLALLSKIGIGADGRTYIAQYNNYGFITLWQGTMKTTTAIHPKDAGFDELLKELKAK